MEKETVIRKLEGLTSGLVTGSAEDSGNLESLRSIIGYNLLSGRQNLLGSDWSQAQLKINATAGSAQDFSRYAVADLPGDTAFVQQTAGKSQVPAVGLQPG